VPVYKMYGLRNAGACLRTQNNGEMRVHKLNQSHAVSRLTKCRDRGVSEFQGQQKFYKYFCFCL
jgi:hypothetical protein